MSGDRVPAHDAMLARAVRSCPSGTDETRDGRDVDDNSAAALLLGAVDSSCDAAST
jgi:hypothetical protein